MADNANLTAGDGTLVVATDKIGGVDYQRVKVTWGADGTATDASAVAPLPVDTQLAKAEDATHSSGDTGVMLLAVRKDTAAALAGTDGDYIPLIVDANGRLHVLSGNFPATVDTNSGAKSASTLRTVHATDDAMLGALTEAAPATDTASSGLNGRLQRIAQRLTSLIALLPSALGAGGGLKVDGSGTTLPVGGDVANAAADSGNPIKVGGRYNSTAPTLTNGQRGDIQLDPQGGQKVSGTSLPVTVSAVSANNTDLIAAMDVTAFRALTLQLTGTWSATISVQFSADGGTTWVTARGWNVNTGSVFFGTSNGLFVFPIPAGVQMRVRTTTYTSGTITGAAALTAMPVAPYDINNTHSNQNIVGTVASTAADSGNPVKTGSKYNATLPTFTDGNRADTQSDINGFTRVAGAVTKQITAIPTVSTSPAYSAGDLIGGKISLANASRAATLGGTITSVVLSDKAKQSAATDVVFFTADPSNTTFTDNAALAVNAADLINIVGVVPITSWSSFSANSVGYANGVGLGFTLAAGTTLYAALVSRGTPTYASTSDIQLTVGIVPD